MKQTARRDSDTFYPTVFAKTLLKLNDVKGQLAIAQQELALEIDRRRRAEGKLEVLYLTVDAWRRKEI